MPEQTDFDQEARKTPPLIAYVLASALVWAVLMPVADWVTGDLLRLRTSVFKGLVIGLGWGLAMHPVEKWLRRRKASGDRPASGSSRSEDVGGSGRGDS